MKKPCRLALAGFFFTFAAPERRELINQSIS
jgi:hypothetical protein